MVSFIDYDSPRGLDDKTNKEIFHELSDALSPSLDVRTIFFHLQVYVCETRASTEHSVNVGANAREIRGVLCHITAGGSQYSSS